MAISKVGQRRQVVLPKDICDGLGLAAGDFVEVSRDRGTVVIKPMRLVDREEKLTADEEKVVAKGFKELKRGQSVPWPRVKRELDL